MATVQPLPPIAAHDWPSRLRVLFRRDARGWDECQCIDLDFAAHGPTPAACFDGLVKQILAQVWLDRRAGREPLASVPRAPRYFQDLWHEIGRRQAHHRPPAVARPPVTPDVAPLLDRLIDADCVTA